MRPLRGRCFAMDKLGRRPLLISACIGMTAGSLGLGIIFDLPEARQDGLTHAVSVVLLFVFVTSFSVGARRLPSWPPSRRAVPARRAAPCPRGKVRTLRERHGTVFPARGDPRRVQAWGPSLGC